MLKIEPLPPLDFSHFIINAEKYLDNLLTTIRKKLLVNRLMGHNITYTESDLMWAIGQENPDLGGMTDLLAIRRMHEKLIKDEFVDEMILTEESKAKLTAKGVDVKGERYFYLTYQGICFEGYEKHKADIVLRENKVQSIATRQFWLTLILAVGAFVAAWYYGIEIWKYYNCY